MACVGEYGSMYYLCIKIDTKEGNIEIKDGVGNSVTMNSGEGALTVIMNNKVTIKAPEIVLDGDVTTTGTQLIKDKTTMTNGMSLSGGSEGGSTASIDGNIEVQGNVGVNGSGIFTGSVNASNI